MVPSEEEEEVVPRPGYGHYLAVLMPFGGRRLRNSRFPRFYRILAILFLCVKSVSLKSVNELTTAGFSHIMEHHDGLFLLAY